MHANHVKEFLINTLRASPEEVRLKTSLVDEIAGEDLYAPTCQVRYIITKMRCAKDGIVISPTSSHCSRARLRLRP